MSRRVAWGAPAAAVAVLASAPLAAAAGAPAGGAYALPVGGAAVALAWSLHALRAARGEASGLAAELHRLRSRDPLTGVSNRSRLRDRLSEAVAEPGGAGALLALDLDGLKVVNDVYGYAFGDDLLRETARRLQMAASEFDRALVARVGGDEFALLLPGATTQEARWVCASLLNRLRTPVDVGGATIEVRATIGLVIHGGEPCDADDLLRDADVALHVAKAGGKNSWRMFDPAMHDELRERLTLESDLRTALEREELALQYQPVVDLSSGAVTGVEALLRWSHATRGAVPPSVFLPLVEDGPLVLQLGDWVLRRACRQLAWWSSDLGAAAPAEVAVNVSGRQLVSPDFCASVASALAESGIAPSRLVLEVTETAAMDPATGVAQLERLRALGVRLAIDDFGTGHSSLARLDAVPVDTIKVDRAFVDAIPAEGDAPLVRAIVAMAHGLGLAVVAEGVETERQRAYLRGLGCDRAQGYLFARPQPADALAGVLLQAASGVPHQRWSVERAENDPA